MAFQGLALIKTKPPVRVEEKKCSGVCGQVKPIEAFGKETLSRDGHKSQCKQCLNSKQYERKREKRLERELYGII